MKLSMEQKSIRQHFLRLATVQFFWDVLSSLSIAFIVWVLTRWTGLYDWADARGWPWGLAFGVLVGVLASGFTPRTRLNIEITYADGETDSE